MIVLLLLDILLVAAPVVLYFQKQSSIGNEDANILLYCIFFIAGILYCIPYLDFGFGHVLMLLLAFGARLILYPLHWIAWIRTAVNKTDVRSSVFPLLTVWLLLLVQGLTLESPVVLLAAALYILAAALLYRPQNERSY